MPVGSGVRLPRLSLSTLWDPKLSSSLCFTSRLSLTVLPENTSQINVLNQILISESAFVGT